MIYRNGKRQLRNKNTALTFTVYTLYSQADSMRNILVANSLIEGICNYKKAIYLFPRSLA